MDGATMGAMIEQLSAANHLRPVDAGSGGLALRSLLPRLDAPLACVLGQRLLAAAEGRRPRLPREVNAALERLRLRHAALADLAGDPHPGVDPVLELHDRAQDNAVGALHEWLNGWARLPTPDGQVAQNILVRLFGQEQAAILRRRLGWEEVKLRLRWIREEGHERMIDQLGGARLLRHLREAHVELERARATTSSPLPSSATAAGADGDLDLALDDFLAACQTYVLRLAALDDPEDSDASELSRSLLRPLCD
jgi:hypothetical protein